MLKQAKVIEIVMPRYNELKVSNVWPIVSDAEDLMIYFPNYDHKQLPDRRFMYSILATLRYDELKGMFDGTRKNWSLNEENKDDDIVNINEELYKKISNVMTQKSKQNI